MRQLIAICLSLSVAVTSSRASADDKATDLVRLAGDYTAEYSARSGRMPADKESLKGLTLEVKKEEWIQNYRGDVAAYAITLDSTDDVKVLRLSHKTVKAVRNCTYDLKDDTLTVTEQLGDDGEFLVTVWKRKPKTVN